MSVCGACYCMQAVGSPAGEDGADLLDIASPFSSFRSSDHCSGSAYTVAMLLAKLRHGVQGKWPTGAQAAGGSR
jgi:hypothetical protein